MATKYLIVLVVVCTIFLVKSETIIKEKPISLEEAQRVCDDLEKNRPMHFPFRCAKPNEDFGRYGKTFLKKNPHIKEKTLSPVVLVPGLGGSALQAKIDKENSPAWYCFKQWDWFRIWLALTELLAQTCWVDNLGLLYDDATNTYHNVGGVDIQPIDFGGVSGIDYLDYVFGFPIPLTAAYATMISSFEEAGYEVGQNLFGAPYDWRLPPDAEDFTLYNNIKALIENAYQKNENKKVHVVTHSMGGVVFLYYLQSFTTQEWRDKYIESFLPIAGPWAGTSKALRGLISGDNFGIEALGWSLANKLLMRQGMRQAGGPIMLVPDPLFWEDQIFVYTKDKNYTAADLHELFNDIGTPTTGDVYDQVWKFVPSLGAPNVTTHCIYGNNTKTEFFYHYADNNWDEDPTSIEYEMVGDGTIPLRSLRECQTWTAQQSAPVEILEIDTSDHMSIIEDEKVINYVLKIVTST